MHRYRNSAIGILILLLIAGAFIVVGRSTRHNIGFKPVQSTNPTAAAHKNTAYLQNTRTQGEAFSTTLKVPTPSASATAQRLVGKWARIGISTLSGSATTE